MESRAEVAISKAAAAAVAAGHPWIWARAVAEVRGDPEPGDRVDVKFRGSKVAAGYFDPGAPIRVRVLSQVSQGDDAELAETLAAAMAMRRRDRRLAGLDALRLVHGECDFLPGLVIDRYGPALVARYDGAGAEALWRRFEPRLLELAGAAGFEATGVYVRGRGVVAGDVDAAGLQVAEGRAVFEVDLERGHKTGLFLDQRPNRERVGALSAGASVLNLFGYTAGFSIHAHLGGARRVTTVDSAAPAIEAARRNIIASGLDPGAHELICGDAFQYLRSDPGPFDLVVCDPPSFAPSRKSLARASSAYRSLNQLAAAAVRPGGLLVTASCSSHIDRRGFEQLMAEGLAAAGRRGLIIDRGGAGSDHPGRPGFPEGDYLSVLYVVVG